MLTVATAYKLQILISNIINNNKITFQAISAQRPGRASEQNFEPNEPQNNVRTTAFTSNSTMNIIRKRSVFCAFIRGPLAIESGIHRVASSREIL